MTTDLKDPGSNSFEIFDSNKITQKFGDASKVVKANPNVEFWKLDTLIPKGSSLFKSSSTRISSIKLGDLPSVGLAQSFLSVRP